MATYYIGRVTHAPRGIQVKVVDGYVQLWVRAAPRDTVIIRDYLRAPFLKFTAAGVFVNHNSQEFYLDQVPVPAVPPAGLTAKTPPHWFKVSSGHHYTWREGRLHALTHIALLPGQSYVGKWSIPVTVNGVPGTITGGIWHRSAPSPVWFWPVLVIVLCVLAAWRLKDPELDRRLAKGLTLVLLALFLIGVASRQLHGRPDVDPGQVIALILVACVAIPMMVRELRRDRPGVVVQLVTAFASMWAGVTLITVLTHGYVLVAFPPLLDRCVVALLLGGSLGLFLVAVRFLGKIPLSAGADDSDLPPDEQPTEDPDERASAAIQQA